MKTKKMHIYSSSLIPVLVIGFISTGIMALISFPRSVYLLDLGVGVAQYGTFLSISNFLTLILNLIFGKLLVRFRFVNQLLAGSVIVSAICHSVMLVSFPIQVISIAFIIEFASSKLFAIFILQVVAEVFSARFGSGLGAYKLVGSLAWSIFASASGIITTYFSFSCLVIIVIVLCVIKLGCLWIIVQNSVSEAKEKTVRAAPKARAFSKLTWREGLGLANVFLLYVVLQLQSNGGFSYLQIFLTDDLKINKIMSGVIISSSGLFEIPISIFIGLMCDRCNVHFVALAGSVLSAVRWILLGLCNGNFALLFITQFLHGVMICTISITFVSYVRKITPPSFESMSYGVMGALGSAGSILGSLLFGQCTETYGLAHSYIGLGIIGVVSCFVFLLLGFIADGGKERRTGTHL